MKFLSPTKILIFFLMYLLSSTIGFSQEKNGSPTSSPTIQKEISQTKHKETQKLPPMKEGERLTFMQKNEALQRSQPESSSLFLKTLGAMFLIVGLIFFGAWGLKKLGFGVIDSDTSLNSPELTILSTISPKSGQTISAVRFGEKVLLVGSTAQSFTLLAEENNVEFDFDENLFTAEPRSVAEMLAEEEISFDKELKKAENKINFEGGQS